jgi:uncharacterized protein
MPRSRRRLWLEIGLVAGAGALTLAVIRQWGERLPGQGAWLIPAVFLYAPIIAGLVGRDFSGLGLEWPSWRKAILDLAIVACIVIPVFLAGWALLQHFILHQPIAPRVPDRFVLRALEQLLVVALPEEVFFRGSLQGRLDEVSPRRFRLLGAEIGPGLFLAAALFALAHYLLIPWPARLLVFFPGLLFGLLRARSGSVFGPVIAHALSNIAFLIAQGRW